MLSASTPPEGQNAPPSPRPTDGRAQPAPGEGWRYRFPKHLRLRNRAAFDRVMSQQRTRARGLLIVFLAERPVERTAVPSPSPLQWSVADGDDTPGACVRWETRLGLVVSKKVGNAVARNRVKRLLREAFRLSQHKLPSGLDVVVLPRAGAARALTLAGAIDALIDMARRPLPEPRPRSNRRPGRGAKKSDRAGRSG